MFSNIAKVLILAGTLTGGLIAGGKIDQPKVGRMKGAFRSPVRCGWIFMHLEGSPSDIGYQHGHLMAEEIYDTLKVIQLESTHDSNKDWVFFRKAAQEILWPKIEKEYREELQGIIAHEFSHIFNGDMRLSVRLIGLLNVAVQLCRCTRQ